MCLTCRARARSTVTMEVVRTQHEWAAKGKIESAMLGRGGVGTSHEMLSPVDPESERAECGRRAGCVNEPRARGRE